MNILEAIERSGVVGCGGAGFPTHAKLMSGVEYFIVNGVECEPLLRTDRYIMRHFADKIISAIERTGDEIGAVHCIIALKESYSEEIHALRSAADAAKSRVSLHFLRSFYPAGDEQTIVYEVTGRVVPPAGIPLDVGCVVSNVATMLAVYDAISDRPLIHKYLTVSGEVETPTIADAPIGAPLESCLSLAGGASIDDYCVLLGGPMMGRIISKEEFPSMVVTKTMSGMIVLPQKSRLANIQRMSREQMAVRARASCIRCSQCSQLCPRNLLGHPLEPHKIMRSLALCGDLQALPMNDAIVRSAALCCECGICELIACPMDLQPRRVNAALRKMLAEAGIRYKKGDGQRSPHPFRDMRKISTVRAAARTGVYRFQHIRIDRLAEARPKRVILPMSQHIGAPCEPLLRPGDEVKRGQLIASSPQGRLGSCIHASIDGIVEIASGSMTISSDGRRCN
ncbi:MAG: 4Fe-4S dicluster domain-containing protein [Synergistaceae bacterium]|nr:4Fe-4S dicluster domain-containing protein [Synergistaceae bacterium]